MIEVSYFQAVSTIVSVFTIGIGVGYKVAPKTVTTSIGYCRLPKDSNQNGSIKFNKTLVNGKTKDVNCEFIQNNKCTLNNNKCIKF